MPGDTNTPTTENGDPCKSNTQPEGRPQITLDLERYAHLLDDPDLSEAQKREFLGALWSIICSFVELGFGVHPVQNAHSQEKDLANIALKRRSCDNKTEQGDAR